MPDNLLPDGLTAGALRTFIDFDGGRSAGGGSAQARAQSEGVAALWHLLRARTFAYLADEVGMGKTRQAMAVVALQILEDPTAQVVIVCPGETLQQQWLREWDAFTRTCYLPWDDRLRSARDGQPVLPVAIHDRLSDFARSLHRRDARIHLLRYSSFSRPLRLAAAKGDASVPPQDLFDAYRAALSVLGAAPTDEDQQTLENARSGQLTSEQLGTALNDRYATHVGELLCARGITLAVFDEAQYLRHVGNQQNKHILRIFRPHARRWLFLSATPLHSGKQSLACLDTYLASAPAATAGSCRCSPEDRSPHIARRTKSDDSQSQDIVEIMNEFMVRRIRTYQDANGAPYLKTAYRRYEKVKISGARDPLMAITMALVQKRLVLALGGRNNQFRQGECSSFESLATSVRAHKRRAAARNGERTEDAEFEVREDGHAPADESVDRASIDALTTSFKAAAVQHGLVHTEHARAALSMPHAKLSDVIKRVADRSLRNGTSHKTLVFVRRLDTVEELRDGLLYEFQKEVDLRLDIWREWLLHPPPGVSLREQPWQEGQFWSIPAHQDDEAQAAAHDDDDPVPDDAGGDAAPASLDYLRAIQEKGMLHSFQARLRDRTLSRNPFRAFLQPAPAKEDALDAEAWAAEQWWTRFLEICMGTDAATMARPEHPQSWLFGPVVHGSTEYWKRETLRRCILQSLRQTDFLVDLYVLRRYLEVPGDGKPVPLPELLLRFLGDEGADPAWIFPARLGGYAANWREKFRCWIVDFDIIVDKCLRGDGVTQWSELHARASSVFARMQPVFGRSGRLKDNNAVVQFKFPTHPNVLVCTDVLKEGVDLHLFCDEVVHYGVAWTSGDLEQRIGRVDRFGSRISRRLAAFRPCPTQAPPRLQVEFPYLDGTLDAPQVTRVILSKIRSDLRMDLGRRREDMGHITLDDLLDPDTATEDHEVPTTPQGFFPPGVPWDPEDGTPQVPTLIAPMLGRLQKPAGGHHFPALAAVRWQEELSSEARLGHPLLPTVRLPKSRKRYASRAEWLVHEAHAGPVEDLADALRAADPVSVEHLDGRHRFEFDPQWNTLACAAVVDQPLATPRSSEQTVLLERVGGFWLLRSPLFVAEEHHDAAWLATQGEPLAWAYLARAEGVVWLLQFVYRASEDTDQGALLNRLAGELGALAGCLQSSLGSADAGPVRFRSRTSLPSADALHIFFTQEREVAVIDEQQWRQAGRFMSRLEAWFRGAFLEVLEALDIEPAQLAPSMVLREDGVLHLATQGPGRARLQTFLQLAGPSGPWIAWELVATPADVGPRPTLPATPWDEMPHQSMTGWEGTPGGDCEVYVGVDERYRYAAIYHRPQAWDARRVALLASWAAAPGRMRGTNFQRVALQQSFVQALRSA